MKQNVREILDKARLEASENGLYVAQAQPATHTTGHLDPAFFLSSTDQGVVNHQLRQHHNIRDGDEGRSAYRDTKVFFTAEEIRTGHARQIPMPTCFGTYLQSVSYRAGLVRTTNHLDNTIPQTDQHKRMLVNTLFQAFKSVALAEDNDKYLAPWRNEDHDNLLVEVACWEVLENLIQRSRTNHSVSSVYHGPAAKVPPYQYRTFAERFDSVVHIMARNKTVCKALLDAPKACKLVDDPLAMKDKTDGNRVVNGYKAEAIKKGRSADNSLKRKRGAPGKKTADVDEDEDDGSSSAPVTPHPAKQRRFTPLAPSSQLSGSVSSSPAYFTPQSSFPPAGQG